MIGHIKNGCGRSSRPWPNKPRSAGVFALNDIEALSLSANKWLDFLKKNFRAHLALTYMIQERLAESTHLTLESPLAAKQKLAKALIGLQIRDLGTASRGKYILQFSQDDLGELAGISTESVKKAEKLLRTSQVISRGRENIAILDTAALESIARDE